MFEGLINLLRSLPHVDRWPEQGLHRQVDGALDFVLLRVKQG